VYAPAAGEVVAVNDTLVAAPASLIPDPYAAWLFRLKRDKKFDTGKLLDANTYETGLE
jgi:glycine cleavage system H lipoate-binding protein